MGPGPHLRPRHLLSVGARDGLLLTKDDPESVDRLPGTWPEILLHNK